MMRYRTTCSLKLLFVLSYSLKLSPSSSPSMLFHCKTKSPSPTFYLAVCATRMSANFSQFPYSVSPYCCVPPCFRFPSLGGDFLLNFPPVADSTHSMACSRPYIIYILGGKSLTYIINQNNVGNIY